MLDNIVLFTHLVEVGSYTKTAEILGISQPTLSRRITELEQSLNKLLLIRDTRSIKLTNEGTIVYNRYKHLRKSINKTIRELRGDILTKGVLSILLPNVLCASLVTPYISIFNSLYPEIKLNLYYQPTEPDLDNWIYDIALTAFDLTPPPGFCIRTSRQEFAGLYATTNYVTKFGIPASIDELDQHNLIGEIDFLSNKINDHIKFVNKYTNQEFLYSNYHSKIKMNVGAQMKALGMQGNNIFGSWNYLCEKEVQNGLLIPVLPEFVISSVKFNLISRIKTTENEDLFIEFLYQCLQRTLSLE